jgi:CheY-like chemotaxis protein
MVESAKSTRLLVIDDDHDIRELLGTILREAGYEVALVDGGKAAMTAVEGRRPDLILLDLNMPEMDGWAVLDHIEALPDAPPVIIVSGGAGRPHGGPLGRSVMGFLPKPFRVDDVLASVERALAAWAAPEPPVLEERRSARRRRLMVDAKLLSREGLPLALGKILNLSAHGAQLDLGASLQPGNTVRLTFEIPGVKGPIQLEGRVQWRRSGTMGLSFVGLAQEEAERLAKILSQE